MRTKTGMLALAAAIVLAACGPEVKVTPLGAIPGRPNPAVIKVFYEGEVIGRPYTEIATLTLDDRAWGMEEQELRKMVITKAQNMGAQGIIIHKVEEVRSGGLPITATLLLPKKPKQVMTATAIIFGDSAP